MNKRELQHQIRSRTAADTQATDTWLADVGISAGSFNTTPIRLLQAQQQAHVLLTQHSELLTNRQRHTLSWFEQQMQQKRTRERITTAAINAVLNISSKINRQLFRQHRQVQRRYSTA